VTIIWPAGEDHGLLVTIIWPGSSNDLILAPLSYGRGLPCACTYFHELVFVLICLRVCVCVCVCVCALPCTDVSPPSPPQGAVEQLVLSSLDLVLSGLPLSSDAPPSSCTTQLQAAWSSVLALHASARAAGRWGSVDGGRGEVNAFLCCPSNACLDLLDQSLVMIAQLHLQVRQARGGEAFNAVCV
jgi:hypothetical protein